MGSSELISIGTFRSLADAEVAQGVLEAAGIESMIRTDDAGGMYPAIGGAEVLVRVEDRDGAHDALEPDQEIERSTDQ